MSIFTKKKTKQPEEASESAEQPLEQPSEQPAAAEAEPPAAFSGPAQKPAEQNFSRSAASQREVAISIKGLKKSYGKKEVLKGIDLDVYKGELFGFIGRNGIGKSTTIDCMIGVKRFDSGTIEIGGYDVVHEPVECKRLFGYVASEPTCYDIMTGYDYLEFVASVYGVGQKEFKINCEYLMKRLSFKDSDLNLPISGYSHGMKQKLCLVGSLLHSPDVWILDEPTVGLDIMAVEELKKMMREYANHGKTVFVTSHNIDLVSKLCDRVAIVNQGVVSASYDLNRSPNLRLRLARLFVETYGNHS